MIGPIKTEAEIQAMRDGGKILATIFDGLKKQVVPGVSELELDAWVDAEIKRLGAIATYKTAEVDFPAAICISTNEQIVHGIPTDYRLQDGDIVGFDLVITYKGMKTDSAITVVVGDKPNGVVKHLLHATERSLYAGIDAINVERDVNLAIGRGSFVERDGAYGIVELAGRMREDRPRMCRRFSLSRHRNR